MAMQLEIPSGDAFVKAEVPDRTFVLPAGGQIKKAEPVDDLGAAIASALDAPLGMAPLPELIRPGANVVIAFDDATVPQFGPVRGIAIHETLRRLESAGVGRDAVTLICANALHRKFPPEELAAIIGDDLVKEFGDRCFCHDAEDPDNLAYIGQTPEHGYDVEVSRYAVDADLLIYVTAAHGRGFSGGWKSVCVGLSTFRSIRHHHTPDGMSMSLKDNRMHKQLDEMGAFLESKIDTTFMKIDCIEAGPLNISRVFAGAVAECRNAALKVLEEQYPPRRSLSGEKYDVILYGVPDWSPYAIFSHMNPILTLISSGLGYLGGTIQALGKPGCTVIMVTPCPERWDRVHHPSYPDVWDNVLTESTDPYDIEKRYTEQYATNEEYIDKYRNDYAFHPIHGILATHPLKRLKHAGRVIVAGIEDPAVAKHIGFEAAADVAAALKRAGEIHGPDYSIAYAQHPAAPTKVTM